MTCLLFLRLWRMCSRPSLVFAGPAWRFCNCAARAVPSSLTTTVSVCVVLSSLSSLVGFAFCSCSCPCLCLLSLSSAGAVVFLFLCLPSAHTLLACPLRRSCWWASRDEEKNADFALSCLCRSSTSPPPCHLLMPLPPASPAPCPFHGFRSHPPLPVECRWCRLPQRLASRRGTSAVAQPGCTCGHHPRLRFAQLHSSSSRRSSRPPAVVHRPSSACRGCSSRLGHQTQRFFLSPSGT